MQTTETNPPETSFHPSRSEWERAAESDCGEHAVSAFISATRIPGLCRKRSDPEWSRGSSRTTDRYGRFWAITIVYTPRRTTSCVSMRWSLRKRIDLYFAANEGQNEETSHFLRFPAAAMALSFDYGERTPGDRLLEEAFRRAAPPIGNPVEPRDAIAARPEDLVYRSGTPQPPSNLFSLTVIACLATWISHRRAAQSANSGDPP